MAQGRDADRPSNARPGRGYPPAGAPFGERWGQPGPTPRTGVREGGAYGDHGGEARSAEAAGPGARARPDYRGMGPRGYRRSVESIRDEVHRILTDDPELDASDIAVDVRPGEVVLDGWVTSRRERRRAEVLLDHCRGVDHVQNNLRVRPVEDSGPRTGLGHRGHAGDSRGGLGGAGDTATGATGSTAGAGQVGTGATRGVGRA